MIYKIACRIISVLRTYTYSQHERYAASTKFEFFDMHLLILYGFLVFLDVGV